MKTQVLVLTYCSAALVSGLAQTKSDPRPLTAKPDEAWVLRGNRSDEFNGDQVDWRKWNPKPEKFFAWAWDNERNTSVVDGCLTLTARAPTHPPPADNTTGKATPAAYTSAMLKSFAQGNEGYYEARIKAAPLFPGVCPAFWLYSSIEDSELPAGATRYSEVDIVEMTQRGDRVAGNERITDHNLHAVVSNGKAGIPGRDWRRPNDARYQEAQAIEYHAPFDPRDDFHVYGCRIEKTTITWFVDGIKIGQKPNALWHRPMNVAMSFGMRAPYVVFGNNRLTANKDADASKLPTTMQVDYVRVWELPDKRQ